ncbi:MAG TPA: flavin reductase family protein [Bacteriovoracaceae bacterium]|nr:flavin reductase family protein [Bacteriovoracaceae bacterium]
MTPSEKYTAVGHIPSGLFIVAVQDPETGVIDGYLASWIQQVSFEPMMISMAIKPGRPAYDLISKGLPFAINVVGDHDKTFLRHFWKGYDATQNPFTELKHHIGPNGGVHLAQAKSSIECLLVSSSRPGDHEIIFAKVLSTHVHSEESKPMVHVRKSGTDY